MSKKPPQPAPRKRLLAPDDKAGAAPPLKVPKRTTAPAPRQRQAWSLTIRLGTVVAVSLVGLALLGWGGFMTLMLFSGNRLASQAVNRTAELQDTYEQRIIEYEQRLEAFRAEIGRMVSEAEMSRLDKGGIEGKLIELAQRQGRMETRHNAIAKVVEQIGNLPIGQLPATTAPSDPSGGSAPAAPTPPRRPGQRTEAPSLPGWAPDDTRLASADDGGILPAGGRHGSAESLAPGSLILAQGAMPANAEDVYEELAQRLEGRVARLETGQIAIMDVMARRSIRQADLLQQALDVAGRALDRVPAPARRTVPLVVVLSPQDQAGPFGRAVDEVRRNAALIGRVRPVLEALPLSRPVSSDHRTTSRFGSRSDPFLGTTRFHAGQDFATPIGTPVFATGAGVVLSAGDGGGYGNLVQIDHGNGLVTRYAHLSEMEVVSGQPVAIGMLVGLAGSTGRSTGPHLHYETRVDGEPQDPTRFMAVGEQLGMRAPRSASAN